MSLKKIFAIGLLFRIFLLIISWNVSNYDLQSYRMVGETTLSGQTIYPEIALFRFPYVPFFLYLQALVTIFKPLDTLLIKLIITAFDVGIIVLLARGFKKKNAALIYALCPIPILIAAFHGQFDSIPLFFLLLAILLMKKKNIGWGMFVYSAAIAVKTWPLFFIVPLLRTLRPKTSLKTGLFIFFSGLLSLIAIFLYGLLFKTPVEQIFHTIRTYQPVFGVYGVGLMLKSVLGRNDLYFVGMAEKLFLMSLFVFSFFQRKKTIEENIVGVLFFLFVFTPVFGVQWFLWAVPFVLIVRPRGTFLILALISLFLLLNYSSWILYVSDSILLGSGLAVWLGFVYAFIRYTVPISLRSNPPSSANVAR